MKSSTTDKVQGELGKAYGIGEKAVDKLTDNSKLTGIRRWPSGPCLCSF